MVQRRETDGSRQPTALELEIAEIQGMKICGLVVSFTDTYISMQNILHHAQEVGTERFSRPGRSPHLCPI